jgi:hypothetical protein
VAVSYILHSGKNEYSLGEGIVALPAKAVMSDFSLLKKL